MNNRLPPNQGYTNNSDDYSADQTRQDWQRWIEKDDFARDEVVTFISDDQADTHRGQEQFHQFSIRAAEYTPEYAAKASTNKNSKNAFLLRALLVLLAIGCTSWLILTNLISPINRLLGMPVVANLEKYAPISSIEIFDKDDEFVSVIQGEEDRQIILLSEVATPLKQALLASEDRNFYSHGGIDFGGIMRALFTNIQQGKITQGGSTITQQLVKNLFFPQSRWATLDRKLREFMLSLEVEKLYKKDQILEIYLNQVYWGKGSYGIERAAQRYYNKPAARLTIAESAYLVALLPSPSTLHNTEEAFKRKDQIVDSMAKYGFISQDQAKSAKQQELKFESAPGNLSKFPFYMSVVLDELRARYSESELRRSGFKVYTALDTEAQQRAEEILTAGIKKAPTGINQGALVTIDVPTAEVRVIVGGVGDFWEHQWNRAVSPHTIGSAFKPFVYLAAFLNGICSGKTIVYDTPYEYETETGEIWDPQNFDRGYWGEMTVRKALVNSRNVPAVRVAQAVGMSKIIETSKKAGLTTIQPYLAAALGTSAISPLDAANAYAVLARDGIYTRPIVIRRIVNARDEIIEQNHPSAEKVFSVNAVRELVNIMVDVVNVGTGTRARLPGRQVAGKTGTADGSRDVWFIGFTPDTVTAIWGGNELNKVASHYATGGGTLAGIWSEYMKAYYELNPIPAVNFPAPAATIRKLVDPITNLLATDGTFQPEWRDFVPGTEPSAFAPDPTPEQIEQYLREKENRKRYLMSDEELELEALTALEEELDSIEPREVYDNLSLVRPTQQPNKQTDPSASDKIPPPTAGNNPDASNREAMPVQNNPIKPIASQPVDESQDSKEDKSFFDRIREKKRKIFNSPYQDDENR